MTLLVVGVSHRTAPVALLDRLALVDAAAEQLQVELLASPHVAESLVLSTCNRVELYAEVSKFHGAVVDATETLAKATGVDRDELTPHLYVRYDERAVQHLFEVAAGLDSMVVGEQQILGQVRASLRSAQETATAGRSLNDLAQAALRVGKRVHADTGIDRAGISIVSVALDLAAERYADSLMGRTAVVVGAGAMSSLAATLLARAGVGEIVVANRTFEHGQRLAEQVGGRAVHLEQLGDELAKAEILVSCTGSTGLVLTAADLAAARATDDASPQLVVIDLALPHDVDEAVADLPGVSRIDLNALADLPAARASEHDVELARAIVADEVRAHLAAMAALRVEPIVLSLRARADDVVEAELQRLRLRLPALDDAAADELARALRRTVQTLLHTPTVRMKELAADPDGARYATALHRLFDLDPAAIAAIEATDDTTAPLLDTEPGYDDLLGGCVMTAVRVATRASLLARTQSEGVAAALRERLDGEVTLVEVTTQGDLDQRTPLAELGGVGVFVTAVREAVLRGDADVAVHSLKDLPTAPAPGLRVAAYPPREDARDVLVARDGGTLATLPHGATVGTGSPRRAAQLRSARPDLDVVAVRGNVDTRLRKVTDGELDAVVLAYAGLARLDRLDAVTEVLEPDQMLPAPGQGALAVECRDVEPDAALLAALRDLDDDATRAAVTAERSLLAALEAGCSAPVGALATVTEVDDEVLVHLTGAVVSDDGLTQVRTSVTGPAGDAEAVGRELAGHLLAAGAPGLLVP